MRLVNFAITSILFPTMILAAGNPIKLYTNTYDGRINNIGDWNLSLFRKGTDAVSLDWNTKKVLTHQCNLPAANFSAYQLSQRDALYLIKRTDTSISDAWILDILGSCFKLSELVSDFPSDAITSKVYYSEKLKQLAITSEDFRISPGDGRIVVFIDPKTKTVVKKNPGVFEAGLWATQYENIAVSIKGGGRYVNFYNTDSFNLEKSVDFRNLHISRMYLKESNKLGLANQYLVSGAERGRTFLGYFDKSTEQITKRFDIGCYELEFSLENNLALCFATPPGGPWGYYTQDLTTGEKKLIWNDLWHEPKLSPKNSLIIANKQNGNFSLYNIKTQQKTEIYTDADADRFFFLDKDEKSIISVSPNWSGKVEVEKFLISDPSITILLYKLDVPEGDDYGSVIFNAEMSKLYIPLNVGGAYYLDIK